MAYNPVNEALKSLEDRMDAIELRSKLLAGKTSEIVQILEVKHISAAQTVVDQAVEQKTLAIAQQVDQKTQAVAAVVEEQRVELANKIEEKRVELANKIEETTNKSHREVETLNKISQHRARRVFYIIMTIFGMMVATSMLGFHALPIDPKILEIFLFILFGVLVTLIIRL